MRLGIISDAHHYFDSMGRLCTLTPLARQFEQWASLFEKVTICAPLLSGLPPNSVSPYQATNIEFLPIVSAGGDTIRAKINLLLVLRSWWLAIQNLLSKVDAVHIRCPNNISILGLLALSRSQCLRQAVYTGNWQGYSKEPPTYRFQRWILRRYFKGPVAVYGSWPGDPSHIVPSFSPSFGVLDWQRERIAVDDKVANLQTQSIDKVLKIVCVGALNKNKNQQVAIQALKILFEAGVQAELHLLGEGENRRELERLCRDSGLEKKIFLHGQVSHDQVREVMRQSDFVVQPSITEGFSKVPLEAFVHGAIPILSDVSVNSQIVAERDRGRHFPPSNARLLAEHIQELAQDPVEMARLIKNGREFAQSLTLESWLEHIRQMLQRHWVGQHCKDQ